MSARRERAGTFAFARAAFAFACAAFAFTGAALAFAGGGTFAFAFAARVTGTAEREDDDRERGECEQAARALGVEVLRQVESPDELDALPEPLRSRARHVVEENGRVLAAAAAIEAADADALAALMRASHGSQRDLFEVSTPEVDALTDRAQSAGALAARLTGGGFGGAVVALCRRGEAQAVADGAGAPLLAVVPSG